LENPTSFLSEKFVKEMVGREGGYCNPKKQEFKIQRKSLKREKKKMSKI
jgi:hypothetical protein